MATIRDYFQEESTDALERLETVLDGPTADPRELFKLARSLRGAAQMAREDRSYRAAVALEAAARAVARGDLEWGDDTCDRFRSTVADLRVLVQGDDVATAQETRVAAVLDRWLGIGIALPEREVAGPSDAEPAPSPERPQAADGFRTFAAREVAAIAAILADSVEALVADPLGREPLKAILRRQRTLLGTARLDELSIVAESLRAVEDISRVVARLDVAIKDEWLDVFRSAREVMRAASAALDRGEEPRHTNALSRLRTLHTELLERFGTAAHPATPVMQEVVALAPAGDSPPFLPLPTAQQPEGEPLDIADLMYDREEALRRIAELRPRLERAVGPDADARAALDELFDLLRLALG